VEVADFLSWMLPSLVHCAPPTLFGILGKSQDTLIIALPEISCTSENTEGKFV
jgi:hypothetical protein